MKILFVAALTTSLLCTPSYAVSPQLDDSVEALSNVSLDASYHPMEDNLPKEASKDDSDSILSFDSAGIKIDVPKDSISAVSVEDSESKTLIKMPIEEKPRMRRM